MSIKVKISELPEADSLKGFCTIGTKYDEDGSGSSVRMPLQFLEDGENARKDAEEKRAGAEQARAAAEDARAAEEKKRAGAEQARQEAENARQAAERERKAAEDSREAAEAGRTAAEAERKTAETAREEAETGRKEAEQAREEAETGRKEAESGRVSAEQERAGAEAARKEAESERQAAETAREKAFAESKRAADTAAGNANSAAEAAREAASGADEAAASANKAAGNANSAAAKADEAAGKADTAREGIQDALDLKADKTYADAQDAQTLEQAKAYADAQDAQVTEAYKAADTALGETLTGAYEAADTALKEALSKEYQAADSELRAGLEGQLAAETAARTEQDTAVRKEFAAADSALKTELEGKLSAEEQARAAKDNALQASVDAIEARTDVVDVVGTKAALEEYDTSGITENDIVKVLADESSAGATAHYRWKEGAWGLVGVTGPYYTKAETDGIKDALTSAYKAADTALGDTITKAYQAADTALSESLTEAYKAADAAVEKKIPTIPDLTGGSAAESGKYVSGVTVSGHAVTVTKADLPDMSDYVRVPGTHISQYQKGSWMKIASFVTTNNTRSTLTLAVIHSDTHNVWTELSFTRHTNSFRTDMAVHGTDERPVRVVQKNDTDFEFWVPCKKDTYDWYANMKVLDRNFIESLEIGPLAYQDEAPAGDAVQDSVLTGVALKAYSVAGVYPGGGGRRPPSYIGNYTVRFYMSNQGADLQTDYHYCDWVAMDCYNGADVPFATMIGVSKEAEPRAYIASGPHGSDDNDSWVVRELAKKTDIPALSGGAAAESGKYVSGVTVSGHAVTVTKAALPAIPTVPGSLKNPYALTAGKKTYDGSAAVTITAADLGALTAHQSLTDYAKKSEVPKTWTGTETAYNALSSKDSSTLYFVTE